MARILAHAIGGGWDVRHEGCASKCCEASAEPVHRGSQVALQIADGLTCGGCDGRLDLEPLPMAFDRDEMCDAHAAEHPPCGRGGDCEGVGICPDCSALTP